MFDACAQKLKSEFNQVKSRDFMELKTARLLDINSFLFGSLAE